MVFFFHQKRSNCLRDAYLCLVNPEVNADAGAVQEGRREINQEVSRAKDSAADEVDHWVLGSCRVPELTFSSQCLPECCLCCTTSAWSGGGAGKRPSWGQDSAKAYPHVLRNQSDNLPSPACAIVTFFSQLSLILLFSKNSQIPGSNCVHFSSNFH